MIQGQDSPSRASTNVRSGSPAGGLAGPNRILPVGESCRDEYEVADFDTNSAYSDPQAMPLSQQSPCLHNRRESHAIPNTEYEEETLITGPIIPRQPQHSPDDSPKTVTNQARPHAAIWKDIWFPVLSIHGLMLLILASLAILVSVFRVHPAKGLFFEPIGWGYAQQKTYVLLSIPASTVPYRHDAWR